MCGLFGGVSLCERWGGGRRTAAMWSRRVESVWKAQERDLVRGVRGREERVAGEKGCWKGSKPNTSSSSEDVSGSLGSGEVEWRG